MNTLESFMVLLLLQRTVKIGFIVKSAEWQLTVIKTLDQEVLGFT